MGLSGKQCVGRSFVCHLRCQLHVCLTIVSATKGSFTPDPPGCHSSVQASASVAPPVGHKRASLCMGAKDLFGKQCMRWPMQTGGGGST